MSALGRALADETGGDHECTLGGERVRDVLGDGGFDCELRTQLAGQMLGEVLRVDPDLVRTSPAEVVLSLEDGAVRAALRLPCDVLGDCDSHVGTACREVVVAFALALELGVRLCRRCYMNVDSCRGRARCHPDSFRRPIRIG